MKKFDSLTEYELIRLIKSDSESAFREIYQRYWKKLLYFASQKVGDVVEAENIVQDVFTALWTRRQQLELSSTLNNYLVVSVKYRVIKLLDRKRIERLYNERNMVNYDLLDNSTQEYLDFEELRKRLEILVTALPEKSALIYRLNKDQGLSHKQIADKLNMTEKAVNAQLVRTKKILRNGLNLYLLSILL